MHCAHVQSKRDENLEANYNYTYTTLSLLSRIPTSYGSVFVYMLYSHCHRDLERFTIQHSIHVGHLQREEMHLPTITIIITITCTATQPTHLSNPIRHPLRPGVPARDLELQRELLPSPSPSSTAAAAAAAAAAPHEGPPR